MRDRLEGLAILCTTRAPLRTVLAVARVLLDPAMRVSYILVRAFTFRQDELLEELKDPAQDSPDGVEGRAQIQAEGDRLSAAARADGLGFVPKKNGTFEDYLLEPRNKPEDIRTIALGPLGVDTWRTLSSAAHSQERSHLRVPSATSVGRRGRRPTGWRSSGCAPPWRRRSMQSKHPCATWVVP